MEICVDFDGTCVTYDFPEIGKDIGAAPVLKKLIKSGHKLILFTMRSDNGDLPLITPAGIENTSGDFLKHAIQWFQTNDIPLYGIQTNPTQHTWTTSPKAYGQLYIDDAALGCPLKFDSALSQRPFVDWKQVEQILILKQIITHV